MRKNSVISYFLIVGFALFPNCGCQNRAKVSEGFKPVRSELAGCGCQNRAKVSEEFKPAKSKLAEGTGEPDGLSPAIKFEKVVLDFGQVGPGATLASEFKFTNTGRGVLEITKVARCCSSVVAPLPKNKYAPGESGVLKATFVAPTHPGAQAKQLVVHSNDKTKPSITLIMKAEVVQKIAFKPSRLKLRPYKENPDSQQLVIDSLDGQPFSITGFKSTADCISTEYDPKVKASRFVLDLKIDAEKLQENSKGSISLTLTHPEVNSATVPFEVLPRFTVSPSLLIVFNAEPKKPVTRKVSVFNNYDEDFEIESLTSKNNTIRAINHRKVSKGYQFDIEITPKIAEGEMKFTDVLNVNIKGSATVPVVCHGYYARDMSLSKAQ